MPKCARGALDDAGLQQARHRRLFLRGRCAGPRARFSMVDYLGLKLRHVDSTDTGGSSYLVHVAHAAQAIAAGKCNVALITLAGRPRSEGMPAAQRRGSRHQRARRAVRSCPTRPSRSTCTRWSRMRHMYEYGTTSEQLAWIKVAASHHAQHNPNAMLRDVVTVRGRARLAA